MIRQAVTEDIPRMREIYMIARRFMIDSGNPGQWMKGYPPEDIHRQEVADGKCFVDVRGSVIHGAFLLQPGDDPTYGIIENGQWLNDEPYGTIHRIASSGEFHGMMGEYIDFCERTLKKRGICNLRGDTHADNKVMQHLFEKFGFKRCGIIYLANGSPRIAYQKILMSGGKFVCPCCGNYEFFEHGKYEICPACGWEDDPVQRRDYNFAGGANKLSLSEAKSRFVQSGKL